MLGRLGACPLGRPRECGSLWHCQAPWLGLKSSVRQGLGRVEDRTGLRFWLLLPVLSFPSISYRSSGPCSALLSARAEVDAWALHSLDEDMEVWDRRAAAVTETGWDLGSLKGWVGHLCTLLGTWSPALCGEWWTGSLPLSVACAVLV